MKSVSFAIGLCAAMLLATPVYGADFGDITRSLLRNSGSSEALKRQAERVAEREAIRELERAITSVDTPTTSKRQDVAANTSGEGVVTFYSRQYCSYCNKARAYFDKNGIPYRELDVERDSEARAQFQQYNVRGVPLILVGDQQLNGWSESQFKRLYKASTSSTATTANKVAPVRSDELSRGAAVAPSAAARTVVEEGAVMTAKIGNVPLYAGPAKSEEVVSHLKKGEEVVVMGPAQSGLVPVRGAMHEGWVETLLLR